MTLAPELVHPTLAPIASKLERHADLTKVDLPEPQRLVAETIVALLGSARMPDEMRDYAQELNVALDVDAGLRSSPLLQRDALLESLLTALRAASKAARSLESARSGMAGDLALDYLRLALDDAAQVGRDAALG